MSVKENLEMGAYLHGGGTKEDFERVYSLFPLLYERRSQLAGTLSGGEQQMLALGRALMLHPVLLMVDELSLGLAPVVVAELMELLGRLHRDGVTILVVEQHATLAMDAAERVVFMEKGQVRFSGPSRELRGRDDLLRSVFLGGEQ